VQAALEGGEGAADVEWRGWSVGVEERSQQPVVELGVEDGDADVLGGEDVAVAAGQALDESVQAQAAQVVAHVGVGVGVPSSPATCPRRRLLVKPATAWTSGQRAPARAMARSSPKRKAPVRWPPLRRAGGCAQKAQSRWHSFGRHAR